MSMYESPPNCTEPRAVANIIRLTGTGASAPTVAVGAKSVSISRTGAGDYLLTWRDNPGTFVGATVGLQATTPGDVKVHTVVLGAYSASAKTMAVTFWDASGVAHDLAAAEHINITAWFKQTSLT